MAPSLSLAAESGGYGIGMQTCGEFAKDYAAHPDVTEGLYFTWAQGFISGLNFMATVVKLPAREISGGDAIRMEAYQASLRSFCNEHPAALYYEAVAQLWRNLPPVRPGTN